MNHENNINSKKKRERERKREEQLRERTMNWMTSARNRIKKKLTGKYHQQSIRSEPKLCTKKQVERFVKPMKSRPLSRDGK